MQKAVFLDKDGTLIDDIPYNVDPELITWKPGCFEALRQLEEAGYLLVIATNQSGMARGYFGENEMNGLIASMTQTLKDQNIHLAGYYYSPYLKEGKIEKYAIDSDYRKPGPGMLIKAASDLNIDLSRSWMVGDVWKDVVAGNRAGCRTVLIKEDGAATDMETTDDILRRPTFTESSILKAAHRILRTDTRLPNSQVIAQR